MNRLISLPKNLKTQFLFEEKELNLDNWTPLIIYNTPKQLKIETKDGVFKPKTADNLFDLLSSYTCIFTYTPPGLNDSLLAQLSHTDLTTLALFRTLETERHIIKKHRYLLVVDKTPVINLIGFTRNYIALDSFDGLYNLCQKIIESRQSTFGLYNLSSPASEARSLMTNTDSIVDEILLSRKLKLHNLDVFNAACYGGRMESSGIGTEYQYHYDLIKAHLNILKHYPGVRDVAWVRGQSMYFDKALPHSVYKIKTEIPTHLKYNPLPVRTEAGIKYPSGPIPPNWYYKDYLLLLEYLKIPFKILDSVQFIGKPTYPLRGLVSFISATIKYFEAFYPELEYKHLYATIAGSTKSIYRSLTKELGEQQLASRTYDPLIYGFTLARQNVYLLKSAYETNAEAIKIDSIATEKPFKRLTISSKEELFGKDLTFKLKDQGMSTYLTPALKSLPHNDRSLYRQAIIDSHDLRHVILEVSMWSTLEAFLSESLDSLPSTELGQKYKRQITIPPSYGNRTGPPVRKIGDLLGGWNVSKPDPDINAIPESDVYLAKLEHYAELFRV